MGGRFGLGFWKGERTSEDEEGACGRHLCCGVVSWMRGRKLELQA